MTLDSDTRRLTDIFRALSEETRVRMIALLLDSEELCVCDFVHVLGISQSKASRHLRYLYNAGLLQDRRDGTWVRYRLTQNPGPATIAMLDALRIGLGKECCAELKDRLSEWLARKDGAELVYSAD